MNAWLRMRIIRLALICVRARVPWPFYLRLVRALRTEYTP